MKYNKTVQLGLPCTPAKLISRNEINVQQILISYGGSMGGTSRTMYCTDVIVETDFHILTLIDGTTTKINKRFIVEIKPIVLIKIVVDITEHINYRGGNHTETHAIDYYEKQPNTEYVWVDKYNSSLNTISQLSERFEVIH